MPSGILTRRARLLPQAAPPPAGAGPASISGLRLWRKPNAAIVRVDTRGGVSGYGECAPVEDAAFAFAREKLQGRDATSFEVVRTLLPASDPLQAAIVCALLDITGKLAKAPIYQVLGGPTRNKARALAAIEGDTDRTLSAALQQPLRAGYKAIRFPAAATIPATAARLEALRKEAGAGVDFVIDCAGRLSPAAASSLAGAVERLHPLWIDEPCPLANVRAVAKIAEESVAPLGFGRLESRIPGYQELLREQVIDVLRPDIARMSIVAIRRASAIAETYYTAVAPFHTGGRIGTAAALHLAASIPNFFIADIPLGTAEVKAGFAPLPTGPGLGITVNERELG